MKPSDEEPLLETSQNKAKGSRHFVTWSLISALLVIVLVFVFLYAIPLMDEATDLISDVKIKLNIVDTIRSTTDGIDSLVLAFRPSVDALPPLIAQVNSIVADVRTQVDEIKAEIAELKTLHGENYQRYKQLKPGNTCIYANDGQCDEPDFCQLGTDQTDCLPNPP